MLFYEGKKKKNKEYLNFDIVFILKIMKIIEFDFCVLKRNTRHYLPISLAEYDHEPT